MAYKDSVPDNMTVFSLLALWTGAFGVVLLIPMSPVGIGAVLATVGIFSVGVWHWRRVRLMFNSEYLAENISVLSDDELQDAIEGVAELRATFGERKTTGNKGEWANDLRDELDKSQLLLMKERLERVGFYDDTPSQLGPTDSQIIRNYSAAPDVEASEN